MEFRFFEFPLKGNKNWLEKCCKVLVVFHIMENYGLSFTFWLTSVFFFLPFHVITELKTNEIQKK